MVAQEFLTTVTYFGHQTDVNHFFDFIMKRDLEMSRVVHPCVYMCVYQVHHEPRITDTTCFYVFVCTALIDPWGHTHPCQGNTNTHSFSEPWKFAHIHHAAPLNLFWWFGFLFPALCSHHPSACKKPLQSITLFMLTDGPCKCLKSLTLITHL